MNLWQALFEFAVCVGATVFFAILFKAPAKSIPFTAAIAGGGWLIFRLTGEGFAAYFIASFLIAVACEIFARILRMPATIFIHAAVIPLVPGIRLYRTMLLIVDGDALSGLMEGANTLLSMGCMAMAIGVVALLFKYIRPPRGRRKEAKT